MENLNQKRKVLVIGSIAELHQLMEETLRDRFEVIHASSESEGLSKARGERPETLILGYLDPRGSSFRLHKKLREGWITKHIPQLIVDAHFPGQPEKAWTPAEAMQMDAEDYLSIEQGDATSVAQTLEALNLTEKIEVKLSEKANPFRQAIVDPKTFCVTWEQIPGRGAFEMQQETVFDNVAKAAEMGRIHAISVTDNPGGNPAISTEMLCAEIKKSGIGTSGSSGLPGQEQEPDREHALRAGCQWSEEYPRPDGGLSLSGGFRRQAQTRLRRGLGECGSAWPKP